MHGGTMGRTYFVIACIVLCLYVRPSVSQRITPIQTRSRVGCPPGCPPRWVPLLQQFAPRIGPLSPQQPVCSVALSQRLIDSCINPGNPCRPAGSQPSFVCCPSSCLYTVKDCYGSRAPSNMCVPTDISPWQHMFIQAFLAG